MIAQASSHKTAGNTHFGLQHISAAIEDYKEGIKCLPTRKPPKPKLTSQDSKGKGKGKARLDLEEDFAKGVTVDSEIDATTKSKDRIRELRDDQDEHQFVEEGRRSEEQKEVEQLRSVLWGNVAACQLRLASLLHHLAYAPLIYAHIAVAIQGGSRVRH